MWGAERRQDEIELAISDMDVTGGGEQLMQQGSPLVIGTGGRRLLVASDRRVVFDDGGVRPPFDGLVLCQLGRGRRAGCGLSATD